MSRHDATWIGYATKSDASLREDEERTARGVFLGPDAEEERTTPSVPVNAGERGPQATTYGCTVLTTSMLDELRRQLREAEEREARESEQSGIRLRPTPEPEERAVGSLDALADLGLGIELDLELDIDVEEPRSLEELEAVVSPLPELEVALAPNSESNFYAGFDDEHPDGVFVATYSRLEVGAPAYVTVLLPAGLRFRTPALVEWVRPPEAAGPDLPAGLGLQMCGLDGEARRLVRSFARHRKPIFYVG